MHGHCGNSGNGNNVPCLTPMKKADGTHPGGFLPVTQHKSSGEEVFQLVHKRLRPRIMRRGIGLADVFKLAQ
jgi:hypothetical protein